MIFLEQYLKLICLDQWFPKWVVPPPWGGWCRNGPLGGDRRPS